MPDSKKRLDLSNWIIHFVHDRNIENENYTIDEFGFMTFSSSPDGFKFTGEPIYLENPIKAEEEQLDDAASAYEVLRKIITDGYIKASWSYRSHRATIYGPKQAVCFTEMPIKTPCRMFFCQLIKHISNRQVVFDSFVIKDTGT